MYKKILFIILILLVFSDLYSYSVRWIQGVETDYILEYANKDLELVQIKDGKDFILETIVREGDSFYINSSKKLKYKVEEIEQGSKITSDLGDYGIDSYIIDKDNSKFKLYCSTNNMKTYSLIEGHIFDRSRQHSLLDSKLNFIRKTIKFKESRDYMKYFYQDLERPRFISNIEYINETDYIETPFYGLEYASHEVIEDYELEGKVVFDEPTYAPYLKKVHTVKEVDGNIVITDEVHDTGGVCFRRKDVYKNNKLIKRVYNTKPNNLSFENPNRKRYFKDEIQPYLHDIYNKHKNFDRNNIEINYYYSKEEAERVLSEK